MHFLFHRADFLPGQFFDIRLEVHSPVNGSEARKGEPDPDFQFTIRKKGEQPVPVTDFFDVKEPSLEAWTFTWYEGEPERETPRRRVLKQSRPLCGGRAHTVSSQRHIQSLPAGGSL